MQQPRFCLQTVFLTALIGAAVNVETCSGQQNRPLDEKLEFFESRIRPVLIEQCYSCHNSAENAEGGLAVDFRDGIRTPSGEGTAVVPGDADASLLLKVIRHEIDGLEMPDGGPKLDDQVVADFRQWIEQGAIDPRDDPPTAQQLTQATSWETTFANRLAWWSLQPVKNPELPPPNDWSDHPIDRFIYQGMKRHDLSPAAPADRRTLIRRLSFALIGLPPQPERIEAFVNDKRVDATEQLIDDLLSSQHFGERWARHWMDLVRYADSHGSEGDPAVPHAYQYRDYLIRAFNDDVPYDQLVREHIAGDLLAQPRINSEMGINESAIGIAHWRLVFHGFAPTDALDEKVRFTDDQINVFGKTFLGLTISCARCHDHKFDAISQRDYYALFGILGSCRPAMLDVNTDDRQLKNQDQLVSLKRELRQRLANAWLANADALADQLADHVDQMPRLDDNSRQDQPLLSILKTVKQQVDQNGDFASSWQSQLDNWQAYQESLSTNDRPAPAMRWDLSQPDDYAEWFHYGNGLADQPSAAGEFVVEPQGERIVGAIYPAGVYSHRLSTRHRAVLASPRVELDDDYEVWFRLTGGGESMVRYVVQNYPRDGTVYPIHTIQRNKWYWHRFNLEYWKGDQIHLEMVTARDAPLTVKNPQRSWFGVRQVMLRKKGLPAPHDETLEFARPLFELAANHPPQSFADLADCLAESLRVTISAWRDGSASNAQASYLDACLRDGLLPNDVEHHPQLESLIETYRQLESQIPLPTRVPGILEADAYDQPLFDRGDHRKPEEVVQRRFLELVDAAHYDVSDSGRLQLARDLLRPDNPLTARVIVNRIWHWLYGEGLVATPDNLGRLGAQPSHPELLDYLARRMVDNGWSIKQMIRLMLTSQTWQQSSQASEQAKLNDPQNKWLSHARSRRLEAEAIRDALLFVSGQLDRTMHGPGMAPGKGRRRSVYVMSRRNSLDPFLQTFDAPVPFATVGRRTVTNVPAQSLTLLNYPLTFSLAAAWAESLRSHQPIGDDRERIVHMFQTALGRRPDNEELDALVNYVRTTAAERRGAANWKQELSELIASHKTELDQILSPARKKLLAQREVDAQSTDGPEPFARWDFSQGLNDTIGKLHGKLHGSATLQDGRLNLDGNGFFSTPPIGREISEKTLEVRLRLLNLNQRGGGALTIQDLQGNGFDSIVFGERVPRQWLAGSNFFLRTADFNGPDETNAQSAVHLAVAYDADGLIRGYRNGKPYGKPYSKSQLVRYAAGQSQLVIGLRHGTAVTPKRMLKAEVLEARLYNRSLSAEEIAASAAGVSFVSQSDVLASMPEPLQHRAQQLMSELDSLKQRLSSLDSGQNNYDEWARVAHVIFNLKEFIYIR